MKFSWDEAKRRSNLQKHNIDFHDLAIFIFGEREMVVPAAIATAESLILPLVITEFCQVV
ncbi:MAG: hypothetical protein AAGA80_14675 [Cyanobacteria bacterium P01_F01_bin.143]